MHKSRFPTVIALFLVFSPIWMHSQTEPPDTTPGRIQLKLNTDETEAVLAILDKRTAGNAVTDSDWQRLFSTEPYIRLRKREAACIAISRTTISRSLCCRPN
jgi:hypothetical protein